MNSERLIKITCHLPPQRHNSYLRMPSPTFAVLKQELEMYLFRERQLPYFEMRLFWIDAEFDEIDIINQTDYEIFMAKFIGHQRDMHLHIGMLNPPEVLKPAEAPKTVDAAAGADKASLDDPANFIIHDNVSCDECGLAPLVGFRYKCIQCPNYDLCQRCETSHKHPNHVMLRMPSNNSPSLVDAWITGPGSPRRRGHHYKRGSRAQCPFAEAAGCAVPPATEGCGAAESGGEGRHHGRRHHKRQMRNGFFSHLYEIIQDLAETGVPPNVPNTASADDTQKKSSEESKEQTKSEEAKEQAKAAPVVSDGGIKEATAPAEHVSLFTPAAEPVVEAAAAINVEAAAPKPAPRQTEQTDHSSAKEPKLDESTEQPTKADEPTTPAINLSGLAQAVPPEYMRAGIEILNNFSEMFAKMLDPVEVGDMGIPSSLPDTRKNSTISSASSTVSSATSNHASPLKTQQQSDAQIPPAVVPNQAIAPQPVSAEGISTPTKAELRASSVDGDWQVIDEPNVLPTASASADTTGSNESFAVLQNETAQAASAPSRAESIVSNANINFAQLSADLRAHVQQEEAREQQQQQQQQSQRSTPEANITVNQHSQTAQEPTVSTSTASTNTNEAEAQPKSPQEKRAVPIYHTDERINSAVHAMMAMGFSNEGAWLTQLLDSVEGNIPAALDVMSASQRNRK